MKNLAVKALMLGGLLAAVPVTSFAQGRGKCGVVECSVTKFCESYRGSTGYNVTLRYSGTPEISRNNFWVMAQNGPGNEFGGFLMGTERIYRPFSAGMMCIGGMPQRISPVLCLDRLGRASTPIIPKALGIVPGDTRYLQFWYRDSRSPMGNLNFSEALEITFCQ